MKPVSQPSLFYFWGSKIRLRLQKGGELHLNTGLPSRARSHRSSSLCGDQRAVTKSHLSVEERLDGGTCGFHGGPSLGLAATGFLPSHLHWMQLENKKGTCSLGLFHQSSPWQYLNGRFCKFLTTYGIDSVEMGIITSSGEPCRICGIPCSPSLHWRNDLQHQQSKLQDGVALRAG